MARPAVEGDLSRFCAFVRLFDLEPGLLRGVEPANRARLRQAITAPSLLLSRGPWFEPPRLAPGSYGYLILDGFLRRDVTVFRRRGLELVGHGDLIRPWQQSDLGPLAYTSDWCGLTPCRLAVLDPPTSDAIGRIGGVGPELAARGARRSRSLAIQLAVARIRGVSSKLLLTFWHLAERWGDLTEKPVVVPVPLTHELLADLVSAERASVSRALGSLIRAGAVSRRLHGPWILHGRPPVRLEDLDLVKSEKLDGSEVIKTPNLTAS